MKFTVSFDLKAKLVTILTGFLFAIVIFFFVRRSEPGTGFWGSIGGDLTITLILLGVYSSAYIFSPRGYFIDHDGITIKRPLRDVLIKLSDIKSISAINKEIMNANVYRAFGSGGLFGYFGEFTFGRSGLMTWYATRTGNYVLIETNVGRKIILTPDDLGIVAAVRERLNIK